MQVYLYVPPFSWGGGRLSTYSCYTNKVIILISFLENRWSSGVSVSSYFLFTKTLSLQHVNLIFTKQLCFTMIYEKTTSLPEDRMTQCVVRKYSSS
jgi:hypothetical protein